MSRNRRDRQKQRKQSLNTKTTVIGLTLAMLVFVAIWLLIYRTSAAPFNMDISSELESMEPQVREHIAKYVEQADSDSDIADNWSQLGLALAGNRHWAAAYQAFENATRLAPHDKMALFYLGIAAKESGRPHRAQNIFLEVSQRFPRFAPVFHRLGTVFLQHGDLRQAQAAFVKCTEFAPNQPHGYVGLADVLVRRSEFKSAKTRIEKAIAIEPNHENARYLHGLALRGLGRRDEALLEMRKGISGKLPDMPDSWTLVLKEHDKSIQSHIRQVAALVAAGRHQVARQLLESVTQKNPQNTELLVNLSKIYILLRNPKESLTYAQRAFAVDPNSADVLVRLIFAFEELAQYNRALEFADRLVSIDPTSSDAYYLKSRVLRKLNRLEDVLANLRQAIRFNSTNANLFTEAGIVLLMFERFSEAKQDFQQAIQRDKNSVLAYLNLAVANARLGEREEARRVLLTAQEMAPGDQRIEDFLKELTGNDE